MLELIDPAAEGAKGCPTSPRHVVNSNDSVVIEISHIDAACLVHKDALKAIELIVPAAEGAKGCSPKSRHVIKPQNVEMVGYINLADLRGERWSGTIKLAAHGQKRR